MAAKATAGAEETVAAAPEAELCVYGGRHPVWARKPQRNHRKPAQKIISRDGDGEAVALARVTQLWELPETLMVLWVLICQM